MGSTCKIVVFVLACVFGTFFLIWTIVSAVFYARDKRDDKVMIETTCTVISVSDIRTRISSDGDLYYYFYYIGRYYHEFLERDDEYQFKSREYYFLFDARNARDDLMRKETFTCYYDKTKLGHLRTSKPNPTLWLALLLTPLSLISLILVYFLTFLIPGIRERTSPCFDYS